MAFGMTKYGKMNLCASAVAVLIFALAIAAASNPWYYYSQQFVVSPAASVSGGGPFFACVFLGLDSTTLL